MADGNISQESIFICHATEDKASFVRPLALSLTSLGVQVWYDEFSLGWGDSIRRAIDAGLRSARFGLVVLSAAFFSKRWTQYELDGLVEREHATGRQLILPVWHGVDYNQVLNYSPSLAGRLAINSDEGVEVIADRIRRIIGTSTHGMLVDPVIQSGEIDSYMLFTSPEKLRQFLRESIRRFDASNIDVDDVAACHFFCQVGDSNSTGVDIGTGWSDDGAGMVVAEVTGERPDESWHPFATIENSAQGFSSINENGAPVQTWWNEWPRASLNKNLDYLAEVLLKVLVDSRRYPVDLFAGLMPE